MPTFTPATGLPAAIPDPGLVDIEFNLTGATGVVADAVVAVYIEHGYVGDLKLTLISPTGTEVILHEERGDGTALGSSPTPMTFTDAETVRWFDASEPWARTIKPLEDLVTFDGEDPDGTWTLRVNDGYSAESGTVEFASLTIDGVAMPGPNDLPDTRDAEGLTFVVTSMHLPDGTQAEPLARIDQFNDAEVVIPYNDARSASLTIPTDHPAAELIAPRKRFLKAYYRGVLVFWGPITTPVVDFAAGTIRIAAVDPSLRLEHHFLRADDIGGLMTTSSDPVPIVIDGSGMRLLRDAADNTAGQDTRNVPILGIGDGYDTSSTVTTMEVQRSNQVWSSMLELSRHALGPDFQLRPVDGFTDTYVLLDTLERQGTDRSTDVVWHYGVGLDNLEGFEWQNGVKLITHVHALDQASKYRFTEANEDASEEYGVYVQWDTTDYDTSTMSAVDAEDVLRAYARGVLQAYSRPLSVYNLKPRAGNAARFLYLRDFQVGDTVGVAGKSGSVSVAGEARVIKVTLAQRDTGALVTQELEVIPPDVPDSELGSGEDA